MGQTTSLLELRRNPTDIASAALSRFESTEALPNLAITVGIISKRAVVDTCFIDVHELRWEPPNMF